MVASTPNRGTAIPTKRNRQSYGSANVATTSTRTAAKATSYVSDAGKPTIRPLKGKSYLRFLIHSQNMANQYPPWVTGERLRCAGREVKIPSERMRNKLPSARDETIASKSTTTVKVFFHQPGDRGPRHARFPEINVSMTARAHGMSKSQLSRLLHGENCPSMKSLWLLSAILGKPVEEVAVMYRKKRVKPTKPIEPELKPKPKTKKEKK